MQSISDQIVLEAKKWIGTPFHQQGRQISAGCDCIGLIIGIAKSIGSISLTGKSWDECDQKSYDCMMESSLLIDLLPNHFRLIEDSFDVGNILLIEIAKKQYHVCVVISQDPIRIIHACSSSGAAVEHKIVPNWLNNIRMVFKF